MGRHDDLIAGSFVVDFLERKHNGHGEMLIYIRETKTSQKFEEYLRNVEGYASEESVGGRKMRPGLGIIEVYEPAPSSAEYMVADD